MTKIIEIVTFESIKLSKLLLSECNLLELINNDLESDEFLNKMNKKPKESKIAKCIKLYFGIIFHLLDIDDQLDEEVSEFINEHLNAANILKYRHSKYVIGFISTAL